MIQKDIKDIFRKLVRQDQRFNKNLDAAHNKYYKKLFKEKWELYDLDTNKMNPVEGHRQQRMKMMNDKIKHFKCKSA